MTDRLAEWLGVEAVLVASDRLREAYEAMVEGRDIGWLPDWQPREAKATDREQED